MMVPIELLVTLKIPDVTAITARRALQRRMGYDKVLVDLQRADWWRLEVEAPDEAAALAVGRELAEETNLFVNPNKHVYQCATSTPLPEAPEDVRVVGMLTGFADDATAGLALQALRGRLGYADRVQSLDHGTLWLLFLRESDPAKAQALAEAITVSTSRTAGLLANPHSQWWRRIAV